MDFFPIFMSLYITQVLPIIIFKSFHFDISFHIKPR